MGLTERVQALCTGAGVSINLLEKETGLGRGSIARWNDNRPTVDKVQKVADYFDVSIDYLIGRDEQEPDDDVMALREQLRSQPGMRMLFNAAKGVTEDELQNVANMVAAFKKGN